MNYTLPYTAEELYALNEMSKNNMTSLYQAELLIKRIGELESQVVELGAALLISPDDVGRIMHESWSRTKRAQGFHGRHDTCTSDLFTMQVRCGVATGYDYPYGAGTDRRCVKFHPDLIPWEELPQAQQDINLHAFDDVLAEIQRRAALTADVRILIEKKNNV